VRRCRLTSRRRWAAASSGGPGTPPPDLGRGPAPDLPPLDEVVVPADGALRGAGVEIIALAGFMRVLTPWFVKRWEGRMINIHPSLLPKYKCLDTHQRAIEAGDPEAGCTVHWVSAGVDEGEIIAQASVPILPGDTADTLAARTLPAEHKLYPEALKLACKTITEKLAHG
jgi:phosphoribosylglycinamide formyltransferase-1